MKKRLISLVLLCIISINVIVFANKNSRWNISETGELTFETDVEEIYETEFFHNKEITSINIPKNVKKIGMGAFSACSNNISVTISESITEISEAMFNANYNLKNINIPSTVVKLGASAFAYCRELEEIVLPEKLSMLESAVFQNCEKLRSIILPDNIEVLPSRLFFASGLEYIVLPENLKEISGNAFEACSYLKEVYIPDGLTEIGERAFDRCVSLEKIYIPQTVISIGEKAFSQSKPTIYGWKESYAHTYAKENNFEFIPVTETMYTKLLPTVASEEKNEMSAYDTFEQVLYNNGMTFSKQYDYDEAKVDEVIKMYPDRDYIGGVEKREDGTEFEFPGFYDDYDVILMHNSVEISDGPKLLINGKNANIKTLICNGNTLVSSGFFREFGIKTEIDSSLLVVTYSNENTVIEIQPYITSMRKNQKDGYWVPLPIGACARIEGTEIYVPLRAIAQEFGLSVDWQAENNTVSVEWQ